MLVDEKECCGCEACAGVCVHGAIHMEKNREGFWHAAVNADCCVKCGLCEKVCPVIEQENCDTYISAWAVQNQDKERRMRSSSGGVAFAICKYVLERNGVVYGAAFNEEFQVEHIRCSNMQSLGRIAGSKYVQSRMGEVYSQIEKDIKGGKEFICFIGTPCQNQAVKKYLVAKRILMGNMLFVDFICHGVPSPMVWGDYVQYLEKKYDDKVCQINFRSKTRGWQTPDLSIQFQNKMISELLGENAYYNCFFRNYTLRENCYQCKFASESRGADITLGDFWGAEEHFSQKADIATGVSLVLVNSEQGERVFEQIRKFCWSEQVDPTMFYQRNLHVPTARPKNRDQFWEAYLGNEDRGEVIQKWGYVNKVLYRGRCVLVSLIKKIKLYKVCVKLLTRIGR